MSSLGTRQYDARQALIVLTAINFLNFADRYVPSSVKSLIQADLNLNDFESSLPSTGMVCNRPAHEPTLPPKKSHPITTFSHSPLSSQCRCWCICSSLPCLGCWMTKNSWTGVTSSGVPSYFGRWPPLSQVSRRIWRRWCWSGRSSGSGKQPTPPSPLRCCSTSIPTRSEPSSWASIFWPSRSEVQTDWLPLPLYHR